MRSVFGLALVLFAAAQGLAAVNHWSSSGPVGGWVSALAIDPRNDVVYAGTLSGALLRSWDRGAHWYPVSIEFSSAISVLLVDASGTIYVSAQGRFMASTDDGRTWDRRADEDIDSLVITSAGVLYGCRPDGVKKSADGGRTWTPLSTGLPGSGLASLALAPASGTLFLTARGAGRGVYRSTDAGVHWTRLAGGLPETDMVGIGVDPRNSHVFVSASMGGAWRSTDGGDSFSLISTLPIKSFPAFGFDSRANRTYACGFNKCYSAADPLGAWHAVAAGEVVMKMVVSPHTGGLVYITTDRQGVARTTDGGLTWQGVNEGLVGSEPIDVAVDPSNPARAWSTTLNGIYRTDDRGATWQLVRSMHARSVAVNPKQPSVVYAAVPDAGVVRSADGGSTWGPFPMEGLDEEVVLLAVNPESPEVLYASSSHIFRYSGGSWTKGGAVSLFAREIAVDVNNPSVLYVATFDGMYRSTNGGATVTPINNGLEPATVRGVAIDPQNSSLLYAATTNGLYRSVNGGDLWTRMLPEGFLSSNLLDVAVDPTDGDVLYAVGFGTYRSTDRGATFHPFGIGVPSRYGQKCVVAADGRQLYATTQNAGVAALHVSPVVLPAAASLHGMNAFFHSDVSIVNVSDQQVTVTATYRCFGGNCGTGTTTFTLLPFEMKFYEDAVTALFGAAESGGAIAFEATDHVIVTSRLYTPSRPAPTYGQFIPGLTLEDAFPAAATASVSFSADLSRGFRANSGVFNPLPVPRNVAVKIFDRHGTMRGERAVTLGANQATQFNGVFPWAGVHADVEHAYVTFTANDDAPLFTYTSVLDNLSNDPIFVRGCEMHAQPTGTVTLPAVASLHGQGGSFFHSDVSVLNTGTASTTVTARYRCMSAACGSSVQTFTIAAGEAAELDDIVVSLFGAPETGGAVEFETAGSIAVTSRLYTPSKPAPTVGQFIHGMTAANAHWYSVLAPLSYSVDGSHGFRANVGAYNGSDVSQNVTFTLYQTNGVKIAEVVRPVDARKSVQVNNLFGAAGVTVNVPAAYCVVHGDAGTPLFSFASVLDNQSQDPVFIYGQWYPWR